MHTDTVLDPLFVRYRKCSVEMPIGLARSVLAGNPRAVVHVGLDSLRNYLWPGAIHRLRAWVGWDGVG